MRTARGPRQQITAHLGKLDDAEQGTARGWQDSETLLSGQPLPKMVKNLVRKIAPSAS